MRSARVRLGVFVIGLVLIAFGAIGLLFHTPWGDVANSLFTIFGTTASFAQFSIGFSSLKPADKPALPVPTSPYSTSAPAGYALPGALQPSSPQSSQPLMYTLPGAPSSPAQGPHKTYVFSGSALVLASACIIVHVFVLFLGNSSLTTSQAIVSDGAFGLANIFLLGGTRGFYEKHASRAGWLGVVGILMVAGGAILNAVIGGIEVVTALVSNYSFSLETYSAISTLVIVNNFFFLIGGTSILGLSIIRGRVFPRWTGVALIVIGCLSLIYYVSSDPSILFYYAIELLVVAIDMRLGLALLKPSSAVPKVSVAPATSTAPVPVDAQVPIAPAVSSVPASVPPAPTYESPPSAPTAPPKERPLFCPLCGTPQASGAIVCSRCGFDFSQVLAQMQGEKTPPVASALQDLPEKTLIQAHPVVAGPKGVFALPAGRQVFITTAGAIVGRGAVSGPDVVDVDLSSEAEKATVSRRHARITWGESHFEIEDLESANQTRLNNQHLVPGQRYPLHNGDDVEFGSVRCRFTIQEH